MPWAAEKSVIHLSRRDSYETSVFLLSLDTVLY